MSWYRTGTISVTQGSPTVTGVNTLWLTQAKVGDILVGPDLVFYEITAVASNTSLTIKKLDGTAAYAGTTASAQGYAIIRNFTYSTNADLAARLAALMTKWHGSQDELTAWMAGTATGGTNGAYPMTNPVSGVVTQVKCLAKLQAEVDAHAVTVSNFVAAAEAEVEGFGGLDLPASRPSLLLDFKKGHIDPRITFTRASAATYFDNQGVLRTALSGEPRIDHDPVTGACLGLLVEESRTNLLLQSAVIEGSPWTTSAPYSISANAVTAPDGTLSADAIILAADQNSFSANVTRQVVAKAASAIQYTLSAMIKPLGATTSVLIIPFGADSNNNASVTIDLLTGAILAVAATTGNFSGASARVAAIGNGWFRVTLIFTSDSSTQLTCRWFPYVGTAALVGDGVSGLYLWGAQLEAGAFPTSYIPTTTAAATRASDVATMTGTNFSSWYRQDGGTFVFESDHSVATPNGSYALQISDNSSSNYMTGYSLNNKTVFRLKAGETDSVYSLGLATIPNGVRSRSSFAYGANDFAASVDGATPLIDNSVIVPTVDRLAIGCAAYTGTVSANGHVQRIAYYPKRLTNTELVALSTP